MNRAEAETYAKDWIDCWNRADVETVAGHYAGDCTFTSPRAAQVVGHSVVRGRAALQAYWVKGRAIVGGFDFRLLGTDWDQDTSTLAVRYVSMKASAGPTRIIEIMRFGEDGKIVEGEVFHGALAQV